MSTTAEVEPNQEEQAEAEAQENTGLDETERRHYEAIREKETEVRVLEGTAKDAKEHAAACKKKFERADEQLRDLIRTGLDPQKELPFEQADANAWRDLDLDELEMTDSQRKKLAEHFESKSLPATLGSLSDWRNRYNETWYQDIDGIGQKAAEAIDNAWVEFWAKHPECGDTKPPEGTPESPRQVKILRPIADNPQLTVGDVYDVDEEEMMARPDTAEGGSIAVVDPTDNDGTLYLQEGEWEIVPGSVQG